MNYKVEVCAGSVQSVIEAERGGASRVELCDNLFEGGTTPSAATISLSCTHVSIPVYVMIRPRGGDFLYSNLEFEIMKRDIYYAKQYGASGIAIGLLMPDGKIDVERTSTLVNIAKQLEMGVTFHRAFDMTPDLFKSLEDVISCGCERLLTSGGENKAIDGISVIKQLVDKSSGRISIMAGSGVNPENALQLIQNTGISEIHMSGKKRIPGKMIYKNSKITMGGISGIPEYEIDVTDAVNVKNVVEKINFI